MSLSRKPVAVGAPGIGEPDGAGGGAEAGAVGSADGEVLAGIVGDGDPVWWVVVVADGVALLGDAQAVASMTTRLMVAARERDVCIATAPLGAGATPDRRE